MAYSSSRASRNIQYGVFLCLLLVVCLAAKTGSEIDFSPVPRTKYDVFLSFRGTDVRPGILSHLINAVSRKHIFTFVDYKLERGDEISAALFEAIKRSSISLVIFSENYASSHWCLDELVKIIECRQRHGMTVIPVFYKVDPSDVRHQRGSYGEALAELEKSYSLLTVQIWRAALKETATLSGFDSSRFSNDAELLDEIVKSLLKELNYVHLINLKRLVGIHKPIAHVTSLLRQESEDVRLIGIWGMVGIGKTTIAEELFIRLCSEYEGCSFLANVREESERHGIIYLKQKLFSTLLEDLKIDTAYGLPSYVKLRLGYKKVLIVLDDVNDSDQLEILVGGHDWFGSGSGIIVTTRDRQVLVANKVHDIYHVGLLSYGEAFELFSLHAFDTGHPEMEYYELTKRVVEYASGVPLVLKVLGHHLHGKDKEIWESQLDKLKKMPSKKIHNALRLSYDDLDLKEQKIFLNLACFFSGLNLEVRYIKILLKDHESDNSVAVGLERLKDKALIAICEGDIVFMHDIIQEVGREIVRQDSSNPGSRSRLWDPDDIYEVFKNDKGTEAIRSIRTHLSANMKLKLGPHIFVKMNNLQFLDFHSEYEQDSLDLLPQGLHSLPTELRYLRWTNYPLKSLPKNFSAENLVILDLSYSKLEKLWHGVQNLVNLKEVKLRGSKFLKELPDFSKAINLEVLDIRFCGQLTVVHPSIFSRDKPVKIYFSCRQVQSGAFLDVAAPNGLFGLGMEKISVPSMLSKEGFTADLFSICFGRDGIGRISFGNNGSLDQDETPFNLNHHSTSHSPTYNITVTQVRVGTTLIDVQFTALFDSGTSFTYLVDPTYTRLTESFHSQVQDRRRPSDSRIPFEYCYDMSPEANTGLIPSMSLTMGGGSHFAVYDPIIIISTQSELVYCLAVVKSAELSIIGQNFMTGYRVVFDREKLTLGWKKSDCYDIDDHNAVPTRPHSDTVPPAVAAGLGHYPATDSTRKTKHNSQSSIASVRSHYSHTSVLSLTCFGFLISCILFCLRVL